MNNIVFNNFSGVLCQRQTTATCSRDVYVKSRQRQILGAAPSRHVAWAAWLRPNTMTFPDWRLIWQRPNRASLLKPGRPAAEVRFRWSCLLWKTSMRFLYEHFRLDRVSCCVSWLVFFCICFDQLHVVVEALFLPVWLDLACQLHLVLLFSYFVDLITSGCSHLP